MAKPKDGFWRTIVGYMALGAIFVIVLVALGLAHMFASNEQHATDEPGRRDENRHLLS